ncbi:hypothetical protein [uncultured Thalassospira sp.]
MPFSDFGRRKVLAVFDGDGSGGMYVQDDPQSETLLYGKRLTTATLTGL